MAVVEGKELYPSLWRWRWWWECVYAGVFVFCSHHTTTTATTATAAMRTLQASKQARRQAGKQGSAGTSKQASVGQHNVRLFVYRNPLANGVGYKHVETWFGIFSQALLCPCLLGCLPTCLAALPACLRACLLVVAVVGASEELPPGLWWRQWSIRN